MAQELGLFQGVKTFQTQHSPLISDETLQRARAVTAWALFKYSSFISLPGMLNTIANEEGVVEAYHMHRVPILRKPPTVPMPDGVPPDGLGPLPSAFPRNHPTVGSSYLFALQKAYSRLQVIVTEISTKHFIIASENNATFAQPDSIAIYQRLFD